MKPDCLNERDLILLHYGEAPEGLTLSAATAHLAGCPGCRERRDRLVADLARIPAIADPDPVVATRIAARVNERLQGGSARRWLPLISGAAVAAAALVITFTALSPQQGIEPAAPPVAPTMVSIDVEEEMPDIEFLEELELIEELEFLRQIEGV